MPSIKFPIFATVAFALIAAALALYSVFGLPVVLLLLSAFALSGVIALIWGSLTSLTGDSQMSFEEALSLAAPTVEEEQKRAVLRALKDLEYELFVGKISQQDFDELSAHYRTQARNLIARADESLGQRLDAAEQRLKRALEAAESTARPSEKLERKAQQKAGTDRSLSPRELNTTARETPSARRIRKQKEAGADLDVAAAEDRSSVQPSSAEETAAEPSDRDAPKERG